MRARTLALTSVVALVAVAIGMLAASGGAATKAPAAAAKATASCSKIGLVTDIGGLNDRSFNHLAYLGLQAAQRKLHVSTRVLESHSNADYIPNMSSLAQQGYCLVIGVGFLMHDSIRTVAKKFPSTNFMIRYVEGRQLSGESRNGQPPATGVSRPP